MNKSEFTQFVKDNISYKDWIFIVNDKNGAIYLQIQFLAPDNITGANERQYCRKWLLSEYMTTSEIVETCWAAVQRAEIHEAAELFKYKGSDIYNRHISVDSLVELHKQENILDKRK